MSGWLDLLSKMKIEGPPMCSQWLIQDDKLKESTVKHFLIHLQFCSCVVLLTSRPLLFLSKKKSDLKAIESELIWPSLHLRKIINNNAEEIFADLCSLIVVAFSQRLELKPLKRKEKNHQAHAFLNIKHTSLRALDIYVCTAQTWEKKQHLKTSIFCCRKINERYQLDDCKIIMAHTCYSISAETLYQVHGTKEPKICLQTSSESSHILNCVSCTLYRWWSVWLCITLEMHSQPNLCKVH